MKNVIRNALACALLTSFTAGCGGEDGPAAQGEPEGPNESVAELASQIDVPTAQVQGKIALALAGSRIQISNTSTGIPLSGGAMSYFKVGAVLAAAGQTDTVINFPPYERDLGAKFVAAEYFGTGGTLIVDKVRIRANGLAADLGFGNPVFSLDANGIVADLTVDAGHPTIFCDGNAWLPPFLGFPVPLGWRDDACPDAEIHNFHIQLRIVPGVDSASHLTIDDITVTILGDIDAGTVPNMLQSLYDWKGYVRGKVQDFMKTLLLGDKVKRVLVSALQQLIDNAAGMHVDTFSRVRTDAAGLHAFPGTVCIPTTCAAQHATCGHISNGCGLGLDCGTCSVGVCNASHFCQQTRAECLNRCTQQRTACIQSGRAPLSCTTAYTLCTRGCPAS